MILIDDRSGSRELINIPPLDRYATLSRLSTGSTKSADVAFLANGPHGSEMLGIEVKSVDDLIDSLESARLQGMDGQMEKMREDYSPGFRWLLIYGQYKPSSEPVITGEGKPSYLLQVYRDQKGKINRKSGWFTKKLGTRAVPYGYVEGFLSGPALPSIGFNLHRVNTLEEAAVWIYILHHTWTKEWDKHKSLRSINKTGKIDRLKKGDTESNDDLEESFSILNASNASESKMSDLFKYKANFAALHQGMGYERSIAAAKYFEGRSLEDMVNASVNEWAGIQIEKKGKRVISLGYPVAERICKKIREK